MAAPDIQREPINDAYEDVRKDASPTTWAILSYDGNTIVLNATGEEFDDFRSRFTDDERLFGFVRLTTGDEPKFKSARAKFVLVTWIGAEVSALKRARVSTDKTLVKSVVKNFALEIQTSEASELDEVYIKQLLVKAGGADYGTGVRD